MLMIELTKTQYKNTIPIQITPLVNAKLACGVYQRAELIAFAAKYADECDSHKV